MTRLPRLALALLLSMAPSVAAVEELRPKTIILGFDGMDFALTQQFMDEGLLPNFRALAGEGLFQPLQTTNPAQSPVSWAVFNTGCNPGKTGVAGFIARTLPARHDGKGGPSLQMMLGFQDKIPAHDFVRFPLALESPLLFMGAAAMIGLGVGFLLFRLVLRRSAAISVVLALLAGGGMGWWARSYVACLPADGKVPYVVNPMQGTYFWTYLDQAGVRVRGIHVPQTFPPDDPSWQHTQLISGLGTLDVTGSPNAWTIYTDDPWQLRDEDKRDTSGLFVKLYEEGGKVLSKLIGPRNWVERAARDTHIKGLEALKDDAALSTSESGRVEEELDQAKADLKRWTNAGEKTSVPFTLDVDRAGHAVTVHVAGRSLRLQQGGWSDFVPVSFTFNDAYAAHALARFHLVRCDEEELRLFVPPISVAPDGAPPWLPVSSPSDFAAHLMEDIGPFETIGWPYLTNVIKDMDEAQVSAQSYFDQDTDLMRRREAILANALEQQDEWDVYYQVFGSTDRVGHMFFREFDPQHPEHDPAYAATVVKGYGRSFPLQDALPEIYKEADRIVGDIARRARAGELGPDCLVLVVSDHGFTSFRRQVNLNNFLLEKGYLVLKEGVSFEEARDQAFLGYVDWARTRAYSMGLGEVYVNLQGRELYLKSATAEEPEIRQDGIVKPEDYDTVVAAIQADLLALTDGEHGRVVTSAERRDALYTGPWWKEGTGTRKKRGVPEEVEHDGFADIFLGYAPFYRVSWSNSDGSLDSATITVNTNHWSGDHVSVDPRHVRGVLFSNKKLSQPTDASLLDFAPTLLVRYGLDPSTTDMDGRPLPFVD